MIPYDIIKHPLNTEKAVKFIDTQNTLLFVVDKRASKMTIKKAVEKTFNVRVLKVNTLLSTKGEKRAYVKLDPVNPAADVMTKLGLM